MDLFIKNAQIMTPFARKQGIVVIRDGKIDGIYDHVDIPQGARVLDANGMILSPGFVDIHVHGGGGYDAMNGKAEEIVAMYRAHAAQGTTSMLPTTLAAPLSMLYPAVEAVDKARLQEPGILGIHLEGPFLSPVQSGAQGPDCIFNPADVDYIPLLDASKNIRMMGAAPELPGAPELARELVKRGIIPSIAHSNATYEDVLTGIEAGFCDVTHLYSCCSTVIRRNGYRIPGVVEAGYLRDELTVQAIADLRHLPVALLQLIHKVKGAEMISLITDGLQYSASHLEEGHTYRMKNGLDTVYEDGVMKLMDRQAFAGSVATMSTLVRNTHFACGIPLSDVLRMASTTPAERIGFGKSKGRIEAGYDADCLLLDQDLNVRTVIINGQIR